MTYRSFTTPRILLKKLIERYNVPPRIAQRDEKVVKVRPIQGILCDVQRLILVRPPGRLYSCVC